MPSRTSRTVRREHFNARAISRKPRPSDSRRLISAYRSTVNLLRAIATPSASCKTDDGTGPDRHRRRLARVVPIRGNRVGPISGNQVVPIPGNRVVPIRGNFALATVGEITASIAHEINQPLGAILNNAEAGLMLLSSTGTCPPEMKEILE